MLFYSSSFWLCWTVLYLVMNCSRTIPSLTNAITIDEAIAKDRNRLAVVYVYTVVPARCSRGLPEYISVSLQQARHSQPDCHVMLISNFAQCEELSKSVDQIHGLVKVDSTKIISNRTEVYLNASKEIFMSDELWLTAALRFYILEDLMVSYNITELVHVEADNTLYLRLTSILPILREGYKGLATTPLSANKSMITASVLWISNLNSLVKFNDYMMALTNTSGTDWIRFTTWLRRYACCRKGGINPDSNGNGIKPFAINEMSMLAYYHIIEPNELQNFPVVPPHEYRQVRPFCNQTAFSPNGGEVGPSTGQGVWDPNSWGQYVGGTAKKRGKDKGFIDMGHIIGQAIRTNGCGVSMLCDNRTTDSAWKKIVSLDPDSSSSGKCYTAPFVRCHVNESWTPLWNLHVHSKHTINYKSEECICA